MALTLAFESHSCSEGFRWWIRFAWKQQLWQNFHLRRRSSIPAYCFPSRACGSTLHFCLIGHHRWFGHWRRGGRGRWQCLRIPIRSTKGFFSTDKSNETEKNATKVLRHSFGSPSEQRRRCSRGIANATRTELQLLRDRGINASCSCRVGSLFWTQGEQSPNHRSYSRRYTEHSLQADPRK